MKIAINVAGVSKISIAIGGKNNKYRINLGKIFKSIINKAHRRFKTSRTPTKNITAKNSRTNIIPGYRLNHLCTNSIICPMQSQP
jgi:hypothetical protein